MNYKPEGQTSFIFIVGLKLIDEVKRNANLCAVHRQSFEVSVFMFLLLTVYLGTLDLGHLITKFVTKFIEFRYNEIRDRQYCFDVSCAT
jgi:hypothetical protein